MTDLAAARLGISVARRDYGVLNLLPTYEHLSAMPSLMKDGHRLCIFVGGQAAPQLALALLCWQLVERPRGNLAGGLEVANTEAAQSALALLRLGGTVVLRLGSEDVFSGQLVALES